MKKLRFSFRFFSRFFAALNREAALDSFRNVMAVVGVGAILGDFITMNPWFVAPCFALLFFVWFADYARHDFSAVELARAEACALELKEAK